MSLIASFMNLAGPDLIVILLIVLVLFGAKKLPELARGMGQAVKEFQKAKDEFNDELHKAGKSETETAKSEVKPAQSTVPAPTTSLQAATGKLIKRKEASPVESDAGAHIPTSANHALAFWCPAAFSDESFAIEILHV